MNNVCDRLVSIARWQNQMMSIAILTLLLSLLVPVVWAQNHPDDLTTLGLEELMKIKDGKYRLLYSLQAKGFELDDKDVVSKHGVVVELQEDIVEGILKSE